MARDGQEVTADLDRVVGDAVTLSAVREGYANLVYKTLEALRWALQHVPFGALLKTDDDSIVHIGRASQWLHLQRQRSSHFVASMYAGRVFNDSQVIRHNFTKRNLLHPEWFPDDFTKWAVPFEALATSALTAGYFYPPYASGGGYFLGAAAAREVAGAYDARQAAGRPVVRVEDAFVGILAREAGLTATDISELVQDPPAGRPQEASTFGGQILVHRVRDFAAAFQWLIFPVKTAFVTAFAREVQVHEGRRVHARGKGRKQLPVR